LPNRRRANAQESVIFSVRVWKRRVRSAQQLPRVIRLCNFADGIARVFDVSRSSHDGSARAELTAISTP
jgi:hypothetical protein